MDLGHSRNETKQLYTYVVLYFTRNIYDDKTLVFTCYLSWSARFTEKIFTQTRNFTAYTLPSTMFAVIECWDHASEGLLELLSSAQ